MFDLTVIGDINLDLCTCHSLKLAFSDLVKNSHPIWEPLEEVPGGTGLNFAKYARDIGLSPLLLGCVGDDLPGRFLRNWLTKMGFVDGLSQSSKPTGRAFITRDRNDIRLLIDNSPNANNDLTYDAITKYLDIIRKSGILYISGYAIRLPGSSRHEATLQLLQCLADNRSVNVIFDVVPHEMYKLYSFEHFYRITQNAKVLVSDVNTMRRFLGLGSLEQEIDDNKSYETANLLKRYYQGVILRWGPSGTDYELLADFSRGTMKIHETEHKNLPVQGKRGYGDRLTIEALRGFFGLIAGSNTRESS